MRIQAITFDRAQLGWNIKMEMSFETRRQFTSEWHVFDNSECKNSHSLVVSFVRIYIHVRSEIKTLQALPGAFRIA